jgi:aspartate/methionine/tyrosine aminotransferase
MRRRVNPRAREAIALRHAQQYRVQISPSRVIVTPGASEALTLILAGSIEPAARAGD